MLLRHPPSALALVLLFWQTPIIREFAQLTGDCTRPMVRGAMEVKLLIRVKKIEKNEQNHEIRFVFLPIPQTSDRLTFFSIFDTIQQMQVIMHTAIHPGG